MNDAMKIYANAAISVFASLTSVVTWLMNVLPVLLPVISAIVGIVAGLCAIRSWLAKRELDAENLFKAKLETAILLSRCQDCTEPDKCIFASSKPETCKWKNL
jgi:hypothetical protein